MGEHIRLKSAAGEIGAYLAAPKGTPKGGIVVIQEIFGVNHHIRAVTDSSPPRATSRSRRSISTTSSPASSSATRRTPSPRAAAT